MKLYNKIILITLSILPVISYASFIINEIDADNAGTDSAEFIEIYDGGVGNTALDGHSLVFFNGSNDKSYRAIDLTGAQTDANGYLVICGETANVANCDIDVSPNTNLIQNGADAVALYASTVENFPTGTAPHTKHLLDAIVYDTHDADDTELLALLNPNEPQINESGNGNATGDSNQRCDNGSGGGRNTASFVQASPTPGVDNNCAAIIKVGTCGETATPIHALQGEISDIHQDASPLLGEVHVIEGIVTADYQGGTLGNGDASSQYRAFWLQEETEDTDSNPKTSEAIMVYSSAIDVSVGDKVRVLGRVAEYQQVTQLSAVNDIQICSSANALPDLVNITLPVESLATLEAIEGMRIQSNQGLVVSDFYGTGYGFGNYGQFAVSSKLLYHPSEIATPGSQAHQAATDARLLNTLLIDDGVSAPYPTYIPFPDVSGFSTSNPLRLGDEVPSFTGVLHANKTHFSVIPDNITVLPTNRRTTEPQIADDTDVVIATMNVLNYFNGDGEGSGFPTSRGAPTADAFAMQEAKIVSALLKTQADIIALMELENDGFSEKSAINALVSALNTELSAAEKYAYVAPNGQTRIGTDAITTGLLYKPAKVSLNGSALVLSSSNSPRDDKGVLFDSQRNRPSLIQAFSVNDFSFTLAVNHLKSKGSACGEPNEGRDGQGNCNISRTRAAQGLNAYLNGLPQAQKTDAVMILGDLNAYSKESPITTLEAAGFINLNAMDESTEDKPFSYTYGGFLGSLDHALANTAMHEKVVSVDIWHINSVEAPLMDYLTEANGQRYDSIDHYANADPYRSSDHDPIVISLQLEQQPDESNQQHTDIDAGYSGGVLSLMLLATLFLRRRQYPA